ncbi:hypothetical protein Ancab_032331 [Ancistrocladus abbreviatus]
MQVEGPRTETERPMVERRFTRKFFCFLFCLHFILVAVLIVALVIRNFLLSQKSHHAHHFHPLKWYPPVLSSVGCAGIVALSWIIVTWYDPLKAITLAFWLCPLVTLGMGILLISINSVGGLAAGVFAIISAVIQSLYGCWVRPRFSYAASVLSVSMTHLPPKMIPLMILTIMMTVVYSCFLVSGIGAATTIESSAHIFYIFIILVSLSWTMHVIKNIVLVTTSRVMYPNFLCGPAEVDTCQAFRNTIERSIGTICIGSILVPSLGLVRGSARGIALVAGDADEFMFSCTNCYSSIATRLVTYGNRWGFVHVGIYDKGIVRSSIDTWEMFTRAGMDQLINSDLTSSFCFLCGMAAAAVSSLIGGSWALAVHKGYATQVSIYAFFIGYFMNCRLELLWRGHKLASWHITWLLQKIRKALSLMQLFQHGWKSYKDTMFNATGRGS